MSEDTFTHVVNGKAHYRAAVVDGQHATLTFAPGQEINPTPDELKAFPQRFVSKSGGTVMVTPTVRFVDLIQLDVTKFGVEAIKEIVTAGQADPTQVLTDELARPAKEQRKALIDWLNAKVNKPAA